MTTLATMKARIADDLARPDLTTQIATAIESAIEHFRTTRFYFNETRATTFATVASQDIYTSSDEANIPLFFAIDEVFLTVSNQNRRLKQEDPQYLEWLADAAGTSGEPYRWAWFNESIRLYPIPDSTSYTIRPVGAIEKASPASDGETDNVWMTDGYALILTRAKWELYLNVIKNYDDAIAMGGQPFEEGEGGAVGTALTRLRKATSRRTSTGRIVATHF